MSLNDFATKLTVTSRSQRNLITNNHLLNTTHVANYNELISRKSNTPSIKELIVNDVSISTTTDLANAFNEHFSTIGPETCK